MLGGECEGCRAAPAVTDDEQALLAENVMGAAHAWSASCVGSTARRRTSMSSSRLSRGTWSSSANDSAGTRAFELVAAGGRADRHW